MNSLKKFTFAVLVVFAMLCFVEPTPGQSLTTTKPVDDDQTLKSLLNEVRLLRQTLQNTGLNAYRSQILLERIKISNEQVLRLARALSDIREDLDKTEQTIPRMGEQQKMLEALIDTETNPVKRAQMEFEIKDKKRAVERYKGELDKLKEREQAQAAQLREEQNKLNELEARLQRLEDQIENEIQKLKAEPTKP